MPWNKSIVNAIIAVFFHDPVVAGLGVVWAIGAHQLGNPDLLARHHLRLEHCACFLREGLFMGHLNSPFNTMAIKGTFIVKMHNSLSFFDFFFIKFICAANLWNLPSRTSKGDQVNFNSSMNLFGNCVCYWPAGPSSNWSPLQKIRHKITNTQKITH